MKRTTLGRAVERLRVCTKGAATPDRRSERRSIGIEIHGNATGANDARGGCSVGWVSKQERPHEWGRGRQECLRHVISQDAWGWLAYQARGLSKATPTRHAPPAVRGVGAFCPLGRF